MYQYALVEWLLTFFCYSFLGWCFETVVVSIQQHRFVNRGFIRGPMLPLYGTGAVILLQISKPLQNDLLLQFLTGMAAATVLEYIVGWAMEAMFKVKYWDYSTHKYQYKGRICLQSSIAWGVLTLVLVWLIHPNVERLLELIPAFLANYITFFIAVLFAADVGYAFRSALDLAQVLEELTQLRVQMELLRDQLAETADDTRHKFNEIVIETCEKISDTVRDTKDKIEETAVSKLAEQEASLLEKRKKLKHMLNELHKQYEKQMKKVGEKRKWLLRGNPSAVSERFNEVFNDLKEKFNSKPKH